LTLFSGAPFYNLLGPAAVNQEARAGEVEGLAEDTMPSTSPISATA
jgi:hypothetical protein